MTDNDLNLTYIFEWLLDEVEEGSKEHQDLIEGHRKGGKVAVDKSIDAMRRMAVAGEL
jgi:hypothetical protein